MNEVIVGTVSTSAGTFGAVITADGLTRLTFPSEPFEWCMEWVALWIPGPTVVESGPALTRLAEQLAGYFEGRVRAFSIPVDMRGTPFRQEVWRALQSIPFGVSRSYGDIAVAIGRPKAVRAVGAANGANPVPIIVPCHRVIGSDGTLTGYAGGLELKERLLALEGIAAKPNRKSS